MKRFSEYHSASPTVYDPPATFTHLPPINPLDRQFGLAAPKAVPDHLLPILFPEGRTVLAVIDTAKFHQGAAVLDGHEGPARSLFVGAAAQAFGDSAPYLVQLDAKSDLTRLLLTHDRGLARDMTTRHAYHLEAAIFLHGAADFDTLWTHLRRFTRVTDARGKWYYFRFWEPRYLLTLARLQIAGTSPARRLFDPRVIAAAIGLAGQRGVKAEPRLIPETMPIRLTTDDLAILQHWRRDQFFDKVERALSDEYVIEERGDLRREIEGHYDEARRRGYRIEAASYLFIRACYVLARMNLQIDQFEYRADPERILSPLNRAKAIWEDAERVSVYD